ncbi:uncharacterized protein APUU_50141S [Aspergillus puulaauensis]|uniref:Uncharacterized protein n=1 Tax=Aspergillus puulaauensis TaxID=1220207 RepID=A0A7R7XPN9_9EURO|nr:uncharacterized protein APUU_50141S [Aspergillus puulaauensis]BCS25430.1 hypothetical protein APUU_50141S [Aspergillus puulaauensis]
MKKKLLLALASRLLPTTAAQVCTPEPRYGEIYSYEIDNQSALDSLASECTSINGSVVIAYNYTGSVYLPNIRSIDGDLAWYPDSLDQGSKTEDVKIFDLVSVPDLERLGGRLDVQSSFYFRNISVPKLSAVNGFVSIHHAHDVDLRSLRKAEQVYIRGNLSSLRLESLEEVPKDLNICTRDGCNGTGPSPSSIGLLLLSLKSAGSIDLMGTISNLALPKLTSVGPNLFSLDSDPASFELTTEGGRPLNVSFPELDTVDGAMQLGGTIGSLSMPKIIDTNMTLTVETSSPLAIDLPLHRIRELEFRGNISSVNLPNLRRAADGISIYSNIPLDCDKVEAEIFPNVSISNGWRNCRVLDSTNEEPKSGGLSTSAKVGISIGCGLAGIFLLSLILIYLLRRYEKRKEQLKDVEMVEIMPPTYQAAQQEHASPPEYSPGENGHRTSPRERDGRMSG